MYLQDSVCAQCGKLIHDSASHAPHNAQIKQLGAPYEHRPLFCSPRCVEDAAASSVLPEIILKLEANFRIAIESIERTAAKDYNEIDPGFTARQSSLREAGIELRHDPARYRAKSQEWAKRRCAEEKSKYEAALRKARADALPSFFADYSAAREAYKNTRQPFPQPTNTDQYPLEYVRGTRNSSPAEALSGTSENTETSSEKQRMDSFPTVKLRELIARYGRLLSNDSPRCKALLRDVCGSYKREIHILINALEAKIALELLNSREYEASELLLTRLAARLEDEQGLSAEVARWAVDSWAFALGLTPQFQPK